VDSLVKYAMSHWMVACRIPVSMVSVYHSEVWDLTANVIKDIQVYSAELTSTSAVKYCLVVM
jgi:hypothetical protein